MRTCILLPCCVVFVCMVVFVNKPRAQTIRNHLSVAAGVGISNERFDWSIAGNAQGENPNVLSELAWEGLRGPNVWITAKKNVWKRVVLAADFSATRIAKGQALDTDYGGDNRTDKHFEVRLDSDKGRSLSYGVTAGYDMSLGKRISLTPALGYNWRHQHLFLLDKFTLESSYSTRWYGPAMAISGAYTLNYWAYTLEVSYTQQRYRAVADWNLIDAFAHPISFRHQAKGYDFSMANKLLLLPRAKVTPLLFFDYELACTGAGIDILYFASGETRYTRLNGVRRNVMTVGLGLRASW